MGQSTNGLRAVLGNPIIYDLLQTALGGKRSLRVYVAEYVDPAASDRILDVGCGTASVLDHLPVSVDYVGFDASARYIAAARERFAGRGQFFCKYATETTVGELGGFDLVMSNGLLHHLDDDEVTSLFRAGAKALRPGGRMVTIDPCVSSRQGRVARYLIGRDRGLNVRSGEAYAALARPFFGSVGLSVRHDMLNVPYTHAILVCSERADPSTV